MNRRITNAWLFALAALATAPLAAQEKPGQAVPQVEGTPLYVGHLVQDKDADDNKVVMGYHVPNHAFFPRTYGLKSGGCRACHVVSNQLDVDLFAANIKQGFPVAPTDGQVESLLSAALGELDETSCKLLGLKSGAVVVNEVCPSLKSELKKHDVLQSVNGTAVETLSEARKQILKEAKKLELQVLRSGKPETVTISLPQKSVTTTRYRLGIALGELDPVVNSHLGLDEDVRVFVQTVLPDSGATGKLKVNDIILSANGEAIETIERLQSLVTESEGETIHLKVQRNGETVKVAVTPKETPVEVATYEAALNVVEGQPIPLEQSLYSAYQAIQLPQVPGVNRVKEAPSSLDQRLKALEQKLDQLIQLQQATLGQSIGR